MSRFAYNALLIIGEDRLDLLLTIVNINRLQFCNIMLYLCMYFVLTRPKFTQCSVGSLRLPKRGECLVRMRRARYNIVRIIGGLKIILEISRVIVFPFRHVSNYYNRRGQMRAF